MPYEAYPEVNAEVDEDFVQLEERFRTARLSDEYYTLPCPCKGDIDEDVILMDINMALRRRGVGLLAVKARVFVETRLSNESRSHYTITLIRAYPRRKKLPDVRNCKTTIALKKILNHRITGAAVSKVGFGEQGPQWRVLSERPGVLRRPTIKRVPTKEGWVYLKQFNGKNFHLEIILNRVTCEDCQPEIF